MSETRKEGSPEPIRLLCDIPTLTPLTEDDFSRVRLLGARRVNRVTEPATIDENIQPGDDGWTFDETAQQLTVTWFPEDDELPRSYYFWEVWVYDVNGELVLKMPSGRAVLQEVRVSIAPAES